MVKERLWLTPTMPGGVKVRHVGLLDLDEFYRWFMMWFEFEGYTTMDDGLEKFYLEQELPNGAKNIEIRWTAKKTENQYFSYVIDVIFLLIGVAKAEYVSPDGKKIPLYSGDFELRMGTYIEKGVEGDSMLQRVYDKFFISRLIEDHKMKLYDKFYSLQSEIKNYFEEYVKLQESWFTVGRKY